MFRLTTLAAAIILFGPASLVWSHGHPIHLEQQSNQLVVSQGVADSTGFAGQIFVESDSGGDPEDIGSFSSFGMAAYWTIPGFDIYGLNENSGLYLEVLSRPVANAAAAEQRLLWYWNPDSEEVEMAPDTQLQIRHSASVNILLTPDTIEAPAPIKIAAPVAADMGFHNHNLLRYLLPFPLPQAGAYGFFARLTSDVYEPSNPFLVVLNNGVEYDQMTAAALAINAAAVDSLPGDFNDDGKVDAADYTVWRDGLGSTRTPEEYGVWRTHFGQSGSGAGSAAAVAVPETASFFLAACGATVLLGHGLRRHRKMNAASPNPCLRT
ncbi:MAG: hypothetical protein AB7G28_14725 [Pirellulales bacterium]